MTFICMCLSCWVRSFANKRKHFTKMCKYAAWSVSFALYFYLSQALPDILSNSFQSLSQETINKNVPASDFQEGRILLPLEGKDGPDAGIVIVAGKDMEFTQYKTIAMDLQQRVNLSLWCYLGDILKEGINLTPRTNTILEHARISLLHAGMPPDAMFIGAGHNIGGDRILQEMIDYNDLADMLVLWATSLPLDINPNDLPNPVLTLQGDLDGVHRSTRTALSFEKLKKRVDNGDKNIMTWSPHHVLVGVNHGQFSTGVRPPILEHYDLKPEVEDEEAISMITEAMVHFIAFWIHQGTGDHPTDARLAKLLFDWYEEAYLHYSPVISMLSLEEDTQNLTSPWMNVCQRVLADLEPNNQHLLQVSNNVVDEVDLPSSRPESAFDPSGVLQIVTVVSMTRNDTDGYPVLPVSADMLQAKMKNSKGIREMLGLHLNASSSVSCRELNMIAWLTALSSAPDVSVARWLGTNITVELLPDEIQWWGPGWLIRPLLFELRDRVLTIQSPSLWTGADAEEGLKFMHYCKLLSPSKALEFIYVDGLL